ncbi:PH domain-containing protein [Myxococcus xanthus]|uniref:PH domain-containing protein n=1 Tax=Myxococcus xanthus TaxID=34 RepID=A0A7Y4MQ20_MYXXA|nr:PH domain-containing protein [Myxococcus xanthus]NOJ77952.1 PH domain-containing protein [Myxococcus xanthus]NOJ86631.1 PH domain-containing protein [Myxococcus xanthus]
MTDPGSPSPLTVVPDGDGGFLSRLPTVLQPHRSLLTYYLVSALLAGPGFPILGLIRYFKYQTLRYTLDDEGITVRWGILFRREVSLTYARIQDIHLSSNLVERWLGLARIQIQTASGNSQAEITIEGVPAYEAMRDFLYSRMRGSRERPTPTQESARAMPAGDHDALAATLREIAEEVRALRLSLDSGATREKQDV